LLVICCFKAAEKVKALVTAEQITNLLKSRFWKLRGEEFPVPVLDLQEAGQVVCLVLHQSNETPVQLFVAFNLVLELTLLITV
jgi:hypothetical protein